MIRAFLVSVVVLLCLAAGAVFSAVNPGRMSLDLAFFVMDADKSLALMSLIALGWVFGLVCSLVSIQRLHAEQRTLKRALRLAEQEVEALRCLPVQDAD